MPQGSAWPAAHGYFAPLTSACRTMSWTSRDPVGALRVGTRLALEMMRSGVRSDYLELIVVDSDGQQVRRYGAH
jgi:hypothetical protein